MIGLAGNGEHTHIGMAAITKDGKLHNLFTADDQKKDFMSSVGYGSIVRRCSRTMSPSTRSFPQQMIPLNHDLKPGFEAPVCIVTSLGHKPTVPSRNRTILAKPDP